jgi:DNA-binding MarR family transcriptional regulator
MDVVADYSAVGMTSTVVHPVGLEEFPAFARRLEDAIRGDAAADAALELCHELNVSVTDAISNRDLPRMARLGSRIARLRRRLVEDERADPIVLETVQRLLTFMLTALERGRAATLTARLADRNEREVGLLRDRILARLSDTPARPRDLVNRFGVDPTQVSRALRELAAAGLIEETAASTGSSDRRARYYRATSRPAAVEPVAVEAEGDRTRLTFAAATNDIRVIALLDSDGHVTVVDIDGHSALRSDRESLASALTTQLA